MATDALKLEAQAALDELMNERLLPFKMYAGEVISEGSGRYTLRFYDSRISLVTFTWEEGRPFRDVVRAATLERVKQMTSPLSMKQAG